MDLPKTNGAVIDGSYRYALWRRTGNPRGVGRVLWVMLNPSTADATTNDATIRRCITFSTTFGYAQMAVCNLFAFRAAYPEDLFRADEPVGPMNDMILEAEAETADRMVVAWGAKAPYERVETVIPLIKKRRTLWCLGRCLNGQPKHPLYLPLTTPLEKFC